MYRLLLPANIGYLRSMTERLNIRFTVNICVLYDCRYSDILIKNNNLSKRLKLREITI